MTKENKMYDYLINHSYISENKKSNYQSELSIERAECIANKFNSLVEEENANLKQVLIDIREYVTKEKEFNDNQIKEYKTCIETNVNGKFNDEEKESMEHSMTVNICINYKMNDILQIIDKVDLGDEK